MVRKKILEELKSDIEELKIVKVEPISVAPKFLQVEPAIYHLNNGKMMTREVLKKQKKDGSAAIILPVTKEGEIVLVVEPRIGSSKTVAVGLPAGYIEKGEHPLSAAKRELAEETGHICESYQLLAKYYQDPGISRAYNYAYLGLGAKQIQKQSLDPNEFVKFLKCHYEEALELVELGYIEDLQAQLALEKSKPYLLKR